MEAARAHSVTGVSCFFEAESQQQEKQELLYRWYRRKQRAVAGGAPRPAWASGWWSSFARRGLVRVLCRRPSSSNFSGPVVSSSSQHYRTGRKHLQPCHLPGFVRNSAAAACGCGRAWLLLLLLLLLAPFFLPVSPRPTTTTRRRFPLRAWPGASPLFLHSSYSANDRAATARCAKLADLNHSVARGARLLASTSPSAHARSLSAHPDTNVRRGVTRSGSTPELHGDQTMAAVASAPGLPRLRYQMDTSPLSTIRDPRAPSKDKRDSPGSGASTPHHPDLNGEVATLSNKLISAINHQTILDDALAATRQELDTTQQQVRNLEAENLEHARLIEEGELVTRAHVDKLVDSFAGDRARALDAEREKKRMEQELETLTSSLFEQANEMVIEARKETEATEHRNQQLRMQLKDTEALLANQQEQLVELKTVLEQIKAERDTATDSTAPSTPALPSHAEVGKVVEDMHIATGATMEDVSPAPPTCYSHLLSPVLRTDLVNYDDFRSLMDIGKKSAPSSRVNSGSFNVNSVPGIAALSSIQPSAGSIPGVIGYSAGAGSPNLPPAVVPLKETKFYKRALTEDIEPTLRLDTAPGLSWLVRRTVINSIVDGAIVIEPTPSSTKAFVLPCSLCGEHRRGDEFARTHRFRTSESDSAQRYPLCAYCLNRMRATCDYIGFLRMVKDGHWRTEGREAEKSAWEESVRLRECMFWARIGGGVVPTNGPRDSPRASTEESKPNTPFSAPPMVQNGGFGSASKANGRVERGLKDTVPSQENLRKARPVLGSTESFSSTSTTDEKSLPPTPSRTAVSRLKESLAPRQRSRQSVYEQERTQSSEEDLSTEATERTRATHSHSPARGDTKSGEQGLQISIPSFSF